MPPSAQSSIQFADEAPNDEHPRPRAWLELGAGDPPAVLRAAADTGLTRVEHPGHLYYFMAQAAKYSRSRQ